MFKNRVNLSICASGRLMLQSLSTFNYMRIHKFIQRLLNLNCHTSFTLSSTNKSINLQQWDPRMLSLIRDVEDDTAIAVQRDLHNLECHISVLQLRESKIALPNINHFIFPAIRKSGFWSRPGHETRCPGTLSRDYETRRPGTLWKKSRDVSRLRGKCPGTSRDFCENFQCTDKVL